MEIVLLPAHWKEAVPQPHLVQLRQLFVLTEVVSTKSRNVLQRLLAPPRVNYVLTSSALPSALRSTQRIVQLTKVPCYARMELARRIWLSAEMLQEDQSIKIVRHPTFTVLMRHALLVPHSASNVP
jgi:hypothetical protein